MTRERASHDRALEELRASLVTRSNKELEQLRMDLDVLKAKILSAHHDKVGLYRMVVDILAPTISLFDAIIVAKTAQPGDYDTFVRQFDVARLKAYGYLAMFAPQSVMDAFDKMVDTLADAFDEATPVPSWPSIRETALAMLNEIRKDLSIDPRPIAYHGHRHGN